jgi:hypothetical protein
MGATAFGASNRLALQLVAVALNTHRRMDGLLERAQGPLTLIPTE